MVGAGLVVAAATLLAGCASVGAIEDEPVITGSIRATPASLKEPAGEAPKGITAGDWTQAKLALDQALAARSQDVSVPWDNPETGARGTATPVGAARAGGCRDFMISLVDGKSADRWVQGEACKAKSGTVLSQVRVLGRA
ncbi:RT0821/Lpp0805 family surface protein [Xanthobacter sp. V3C-3]|uniref:RT0821/Lpp0805 family surface protein n=1 Tax=Xanthobacter lutulentifluminis TaxID=3119935 RepID=UPI003729E4E7